MRFIIKVLRHTVDLVELLDLNAEFEIHFPSCIYQYGFSGH